MKRREIASIIIAILGVVILVGSLGADLFGGYPGFGYHQMVGAALGVILIFAAWGLMPRKG